MLANISDDYLLGFHMGDCSFHIQTEFGSNDKSFKGRFRWTLTDCAENIALLKAIQNNLLKKGIKGLTIQSYGTYNRLTLSNKNSCLKIVKLWEGKPLPSVRLNQYNCFVEAINLYDLTRFRANLAQAERFIILKWIMNPGTNYKKDGDLNTDLIKIRNWFRGH